MALSLTQVFSNGFSKRIALLGMALFLVFISWLGSRGIAHESLWYDEVWSMRYAGGMQYGPISVVETAARVIDQSQHERNPPGYYMLLNVWGTLTGWREFSARVLSLLAALLAIAWTYRLGYDISSIEPASIRRLIGIGAAILLGASAFFIQYTHEIRAYIFVVLFTSMILALYWRIVQSRKPPGWGLQAMFVLAWAAMLYTHYSTLLFVAVLGLYHLLIAKKGARWWRLVGLVIAGTLPFLPWLGIFYKASQTALETFRVAALSIPEILGALAISFSNDSIALLALLLIFALAVRGRHAGFIWFLFLGGVMLALIGNLVVPIIISVRYVILLWPLLALLISLSIAYLARHRISPLPLFAIWIAMSVHSTTTLLDTRIPHEVHIPWLSMVDVLHKHIQPGDVVVFHSPLTVWSQGPELDHYMHDFPNRYGLMESISGGLEANDYYSHVQEFLNHAPRLWIGIDQTLTPNFRLGEFQRAVATDYVHCATAFDVREMRFDLYSHKIDQPDVRFGDGIGFKLNEPLPASAKISLPVLLGIQVADHVPANTYSVGLHIDDESGVLHAQTDFGLPGVGDTCRLAEINISALPPGNYRLMAIVYNWQTGERLPGSSAGVEAGDRILLGTFSVTG
jgi:hypothetical protein